MDFVFTNFDFLSINWINDGKDPKIPYPSGSDIDMSHGEERRCCWNWKVVDAVRAGLVFVRCKRCGSNAQIIVSSSGSLKLPCNINIYDTGASHAIPSTP